MGIENNLKKAQAAIHNDIVEFGPESELAERVRKAAIAAITGGLNSDMWRRYMALFCDTKEELAQLTVERKGQEVDYMPEIRAYTPANAMCLPVTDTSLTLKVADRPDGIEPLATAVVPDGVPDPATIRDGDLFNKLRS